MGAFWSKPRLPRHTADSMVFCDGLAPLSNPLRASSSDGRFLFVLGNKRIVGAPSDYEDFDNDDEIVTTFSMDVIDLLSSRRRRIMNIGDFHGTCRPVGFYTLDARTVVLVEICDRSLPCTLYQMVIRVDWNRAAAECVFYRRHSITVNFEIDEGFTFVDTECALVICEGFADRAGFIMPADQLSTKAARDISHFFEQANQWLPAMYRPEAELGWGEPFFYSENEIGYFINLFHGGSTVYRDNDHLLVIDAVTGSMRLANFPPRPFQPPPNAKPYDILYSEGGREVAVVTRFECAGRCWQVLLASVLLRLTQLALRTRDYNWMPTRMVRFCQGVLADRLLDLRNCLLYPQYEPFLRFGILDVKTMEWTRASTNTHITTFPFPPNGDYFALASRTNKVGPSRAIGSEVMESMERIEMIRHPLRLPSLTRLSTLAVQRSGRVSQEQLEQIASRIG